VRADGDCFARAALTNLRMAAFDVGESHMAESPDEARCSWNSAIRTVCYTVLLVFRDVNESVAINADAVRPFWDW